MKISNIKFCSVLGGHLLGRGGPREGSSGHGLCGHRDGREVVDNAVDLFIMLMLMMVERWSIMLIVIMSIIIMVGMDSA